MAVSRNPEPRHHACVVLQTLRLPSKPLELLASYLVPVRYRNRYAGQLDHLHHLIVRDVPLDAFAKDAPHRVAEIPADVVRVRSDWLGAAVARPLAVIAEN